MSKQQVKHFFFSNYYLTSSAGRKIALIGVFTALSIVANACSIDVSSTQKITFTYLVGFFAGTLFGPVPGFLIMFFGDFLGFLINPASGVYWIMAGLNTGFLALLPGLIMNNVHFFFKGGVYLKAAIAIITTYIFVVCGFGVLSNYLYVKILVYGGNYDTAFYVFWLGKVVFSSFVAAINYALTVMLIPVLNSVKFTGIKID